MTAHGCERKFVCSSNCLAYATISWNPFLYSIYTVLLMRPSVGIHSSIPSILSCLCDHQLQSIPLFHLYCLAYVTISWNPFLYSIYTVLLMQPSVGIHSSIPSILSCLCDHQLESIPLFHLYCLAYATISWNPFLYSIYTVLLMRPSVGIHSSIPSILSCLCDHQLESIPLFHLYCLAYVTISWNPFLYSIYSVWWSHKRETLSNWQSFARTRVLSWSWTSSASRALFCEPDATQG